MTHERKILPEFYHVVASGEKPFEIRKEDRAGESFEEGDTIRLLPFDGHNYCNWPVIERTITYVLRGEEWGIMPGYAVLGLREE